MLISDTFSMKRLASIRLPAACLFSVGVNSGWTLVPTMVTEFSKSLTNISNGSARYLCPCIHPQRKYILDYLLHYCVLLTGRFLY